MDKGDGYHNEQKGLNLTIHIRQGSFSLSSKVIKSMFRRARTEGSHRRLQRHGFRGIREAVCDTGIRRQWCISCKTYHIVWDKNPFIVKAPDMIFYLGLLLWQESLLYPAPARRRCFSIPVPYRLSVAMQDGTDLPVYQFFHNVYPVGFKMPCHYRLSGISECMHTPWLPALQGSAGAISSDTVQR